MYVVLLLAGQESGVWLGAALPDVVDVGAVLVDEEVVVAKAPFNWNILRRLPPPQYSLELPPQTMLHPAETLSPV